MNEEEIDIIHNGKVYSEIEKILQNFLKVNGSNFNFSYLNENNRRVLLWTALFNQLQDKSAECLHVTCLATIRLLSRDESELDKVLCEKWIIVLIDKAGLYNFMDIDELSDVVMPHKEIVVEALKCLCNLAFNSPLVRALCAYKGIAYGLVARLRSYKEIPFKDDIMLYDMKLIFILTALRPDVKKKIKDELHGMDYLISCLNELVVEASQTDGAASSEAMNHCFLNDSQISIACEILKAQFNLIFQSGSDDTVNEEEEAMYLKLMPSLTALLYAHTENQDRLMELHSNVANLLTSVPPGFYQYLTPDLNEGDIARYIYNDKNMDALQALLDFLQYKLTITTSTKNQYENLAPILTVLNKSSRGCRPQRKYLRQTVLPPLRDVSRPPEKGNTLRNQLCRLLTTPITSVRDLVAEFLFILCKEKVGRMVKYTGFGNAAGHLAQKGLMGGSKAPVQYSSSSEDSDTEEFLEAQPSYDPVMGCTRPPRSNPFEGMSEEQKEYEAMKLVNLFDKMVSSGAVRPACVGADGQPRPVSHVLELRDQPPATNRPQS